MNTCFLFPGQGSQFPGMGKDLWERSSEVQRLFECAADTTGTDIRNIIFNGSEEDLRVTETAQIAVTLINLCVAEVLKENGITCSGGAGFSLGEFSAMTLAGVLSREDVFPLVKARGEIMRLAAVTHDNGTGGPGMAAVIGHSLQEITDIISDNGIENLFIANYNAPRQIVLAGTYDALSKAEEVFKKKSSKHFIRLRVSAPFHSPLMEEARKEIADLVEEYTFSDPAMPIYSSVNAERVRTGTEAKRLCVEQIVTTTRWVDVERLLLEENYSRFIECGPGKVLTGLWKSVSNNITCFKTGTMENIVKL